MQKIKKCPICGSENYKTVLTPKDFMLSMETFPVVSCDKCDFYFTNPIPMEDKIGEYYKHESYVSHTASKKGIVNKVYNIVRKRTIKQKVALIKAINPTPALLDYGCGTGHFLFACKSAGINVRGLEPDDDARNFANTHFDVNVQPTTALDDVDNNSLDIITMWHVLEHVYHLQRDFEKLTAKIKSGGYFIVAVPNHKSFDAQQYENYWAGYDVPRHLYHFSENDIKNLANQHNLTLEKTLPMKWDAYYVSMLSEKYKNGNLLSAFLSGLKSNRKAKKQGFSSQIYLLKKK